MFGSKKIQELEAQLREAQEKLAKETAEKNELAQGLEGANRKIAELEAQLNDFDLEQAKEAARASRAEYEGLRELYTRKNKEFDDSIEEQEQSFARESALKRHNLENEIRDNRQANSEYVTNTVKTFGESYNYYLNQIKVLMDALGSVATRTGAALFSGENADLRSSFGHQMRDLLKSGVDAFPDDDEPELVVEAEVTVEPTEPEPEAVEETPDAAEAPQEPLEEGEE